MIYDINNWFWKTKEDGRIYSSAARAYISVTAPQYTTWLEEGGIATVIAEADLPAVVNGSLLAEIEQIEASTLRSLRDVARGNGNVVSGGKSAVQRLAEAETAIAALRSELL